MFLFFHKSLSYFVEKLDFCFDFKLIIKVATIDIIKTKPFNLADKNATCAMLNADFVVERLDKKVDLIKISFNCQEIVSVSFILRSKRDILEINISFELFFYTFISTV